MSRAITLRQWNSGYQRLKGDYGMTLSALTGFSPSDLAFEGSFADPALDGYWNSCITSNAANGRAHGINGSYLQIMKAPSGDAHGLAFG
jgi:hypothetical protein